MAHTPIGYRQWDFACDSYGKVRHSRKACVFTTVMAPGGEQTITVASRIDNWDDAKLIAAAPAGLAMAKAFLDEITGICGANNREAAFLEKIEGMARAFVARAEG